MGWLEINTTKHEIFEGETKIGRDPSQCQIIPISRVSYNFFIIYHLY